MIKFLIGNKSDLPYDDRKVPFITGKDYADKNNMKFFETSAIINDGRINDVFCALALRIRETFSEEELLP
jgi:GTPase SAR1 family protein